MHMGAAQVTWTEPLDKFLARLRHPHRMVGLIFLDGGNQEELWNMTLLVGQTKTAKVVWVDAAGNTQPTYGPNQWTSANTNVTLSTPNADGSIPVTGAVVGPYTLNCQAQADPTDTTKMVQAVPFTDSVNDEDTTGTISVA